MLFENDGKESRKILSGGGGLEVGGIIREEG